MVFKLIRRAPHSEQKQSRDGYIYLFRLMKFLGWLPPLSGIFRYVYLSWTALTFALFTIYLPIGFLVSYTTKIRQFTAGEFLTSLQVCLNAYGSSVKTAFAYSNLDRLIKAKDLLDQLDKRCTSKEEREKINHMVARTNQIFLTYTFVYCFFVISTYISSTVFGSLPWQIYDPLVDPNESTLQFWIASVLELFGMWGAVLQDEVVDTYPLIYTYVIRSHVEMLKGRVIQLRTNPKLSEDDYYEELVQCITDHRTILQYCDLLRPVLSGTVFTQFLLIGVVLGLTLINIFFFSSIWNGIASATFGFCLLLQTFPLCYTCNQIMDDCDTLAYTIFQSNWIDASPRYKSAMLYFMHNVQQPIIFIAGGIFPITISSNITVAKLAFSVITVFKQMNIADKFKSV
ncbi:odorant receptor 42b-like [Scaptodrosophila lebanonensis]|uniref:Odorant receptor n=1 Tax=Drosophila lebanonensis TaxID=7225 RepID=A0A6J2T1P4_DROLE|nr:odorant receptor 42b-like [Scaptodrosophila lebanonensis]